jgi:hypothetical protein
LSDATPKQRGPGRQLALRGALAGAALLVGLAIVEIGFRVARGEPWYERLVEDQTGHGTWLCRVGQMVVPLRASLDEVPKRADDYRVLFLGDSFTYGSGVGDASKTFVHLAQERLNAAQPLPQKKQYQVFNGGVPASFVNTWVVLFEQAVDPFAPDMVVAVFFLRDGVAGVTSVGQVRRIREEMTRLLDQSWLFRHWHTYRFFREHRELRELSHEYLGKLRDGYLGSAEQTQEWRRAQAGLLHIKERASQQGARFAIVIFPVLFELDEDYPLAEVCDTIEAFCHDHDIPVFSLLPTFMHRHAPSLWVSPLDQHPNERAHALAADAISDFLLRLIGRGTQPSLPEHAASELAP